MQRRSTVIAVPRIDREAEVERQPKGGGITGLGGAVEGCAVGVDDLIKAHEAAIQPLLRRSAIALPTGRNKSWFPGTRTAVHQHRPTAVALRR